jgi:hypothetical protein
LRLEHPSPNRPDDLLAEGDVTTSQIDRERTIKQAQFIISVCLVIGTFQYLIGSWLKFQGTVPFEGENNACESINPFWKNNVSECPCRFQPSNSPGVNVGLQQILRLAYSFSKQTAEDRPMLAENTDHMGMAPSPVVWTGDEISVTAQQTQQALHVIVSAGTAPELVTFSEMRYDSQLNHLRAMSTFSDSTPLLIILKDETSQKNPLTEQQFCEDHDDIIRMLQRRP